MGLNWDFMGIYPIRWDIQWGYQCDTNKRGVTGNGGFAMDLPVMDSKE